MGRGVACRDDGIVLAARGLAGYKERMKHPVLLAFGLAGALGAEVLAERPFLHPLFSDHAVLQRRVEAPIWGWTMPGAQVVVRLAHQTALAKADENGRWEVRLGPFNAGGPFELKVEGQETAVVRDVMIGDVWLCSGQSNMEWPVSLSQNAEAEIAAANFPSIRLLTVPKKISPKPIEAFEASWAVCSPKSVADFSAVGYFFGRQLHQNLGVPIGLIDSSWGGTVAEAWTSAAALNDLADFRAAAAETAEWASLAEEAATAYERRMREWWKRNDPGSAPGTDWADAKEADSRWREMALPSLWEEAGLPGFDGIVWFRKTFVVPEKWRGDDLILHLAKVDDLDTTFVNGRPVGSTDLWNQDRVYRVPVSLLREKENVIAVRVLDTGGGGGIYGSPDEMFLQSADASKLGVQSLAGMWKYRVGREMSALERLPQKPGHSPNAATVLYNGMIAPLLPAAIRGAAWYQGESNANSPTQYRTLLPTMIADWREGFGAEDLPFLIVQLANFMQRESEPTESHWAALREAQALTAAQDERTALAVSIDIGEADDVHPRNKQEVGKRLALAARKIAYGQDVVASGPQYSRMIASGRSLVLSFEHFGSGLIAKGKGALTGFSIAGADDQFFWADAKISGGQVVVSSPQVPLPSAVRYAWANNPECNLYNQEGLPAIPFRTDAENIKPPPGFLSLFDGKTLNGFRQINGTAKYEVVAGTILGTTTKGSPNSFLCTEKRYGDFELQFEVNLINPQLNSGVQIRSNSYEDYRKGRVHGYQVEIASNGNAGFIYDEARRGWLSKDRSEKKARAAFRANDWNHYRILCVGPTMKTWVNGVPVAEVHDSMTAEGFIGLQVHGVRGDPHWQVAWRNLWIREINEDKSVPIFDGKTLAGWKGKPNGWHVDANGNLTRREKSGYLWTEETYEDFELQAEFKIAEKCNSGIFFRTDPDNPVQGGFEIQILDSHGREKAGKRDCGALYDAMAPRINVAKPAGEWNHCKIRAVGSRVFVQLNGEKIINADLENWTRANTNPDGSKNKFRTPLRELPRAGHIGLQDHGHPVWFRNLRITRL